MGVSAVHTNTHTVVFHRVRFDQKAGVFTVNESPYWFTVAWRKGPKWYTGLHQPDRTSWIERALTVSVDGSSIAGCTELSTNAFISTNRHSNRLVRVSRDDCLLQLCTQMQTCSEGIFCVRRSSSTSPMTRVPGSLCGHDSRAVVQRATICTAFI